jgi:catechol 2,3-dioxygenase
MTTAPDIIDDRHLSAGTTMDAVTLRVGDLDEMTGYYCDAIALEPLEERSRGREVHRVLGRGDTPMVRLVHTPDLPAGSPREAGLFHTAFLFDDPASLAATVYRAALDPRSQFTGSADHLVSEAFYFTDPEGNGIGSPMVASCRTDPAGEHLPDSDRAECSWARVTGRPRSPPD